jgi:hypothetical protein
VLVVEQEEADLLEKFEYAEVQRLMLQERDDASWDAEVESSDTTPWLQYTKWPEQFAHRPLEMIAAAARRPESYPCDDYLLGFWNGSELRSPVEDEVSVANSINIAYTAIFDFKNITTTSKLLYHTPTHKSHIIRYHTPKYHDIRLYRRMTNT